jgi:DNA-binding transcriptional ArsR family regulator
MSTRKQSTEQAIVDLLSSRGKLASADIADATGRGRSTVGKTLAKLEQAGKVKRTAGKRDGAHRQPDRWSATRTRAKKQTTGRLRPGQLDGIVLDYLRKHADEGSLSPTAVAKGLSRSSGAVANCLARLAAAGQVRETGTSPRRYSSVVKSGARRPSRRES